MKQSQFHIPTIYVNENQLSQDLLVMLDEMYDDINDRMNKVVEVTVRKWKHTDNNHRKVTRSETFKLSERQLQDFIKNLQQIQKEMNKK